MKQKGRQHSFQHVNKKAILGLLYLWKSILRLPARLSTLLFFALHYFNTLLITLATLTVSPYCARQPCSEELVESASQSSVAGTST